jgi:hypothetical protein
VERHIDSRGEFAAELLVTVGIWPELVIDVRESHNVETTVLGELAQQKGQRDRIRAARKANEHTASWRTQRVSADGATNLLQEGCQLIAAVRTWPANGSSFRKSQAHLRALRYGGNLRMQS